MHTLFALQSMLPTRLEPQVLFGFPIETLALLAVALLISAAGFYRVVYFVSIGYAFSIAAMAVLSAGLFYRHIDVVTVFQLAALSIYGVRLGSYLVKREMSPAYQRELEDVKGRGAGIGVSRKGLIWVGVSLLYVLMFAPTFIVLLERRDSESINFAWSQILGVVIMYAGIVIEALADKQKSVYKSSNPRRFCDVGLYRIVRCPNYFGEVLFWFGHFVAGAAAFVFWGHWVASAVGLICIILIMMGSTKRLENKQDERYGEDAEYKKYIASVPVLFPFVPIYSLKKVRVYLE